MKMFFDIVLTELVLAQISNPSAIQRTITYSLHIVDIFPFHLLCNPAELVTDLGRVALLVLHYSITMCTGLTQQFRAVIVIFTGNYEERRPTRCNN